jgi:hypothetical protein
MKIRTVLEKAGLQSRYGRSGMLDIDYDWS